jgi:hypothetical protein
MTRRQIEKSRLALAHAGSPADHRQILRALVSRLENERASWGRRLEALRADYRRRLERWRTEEVPENTAVPAIPSDLHESKLYRITGSFALAAEAALAAWVFSRLGVNWWIGALAAVLIAATLHGLFALLFGDTERPRLGLWLLRRIVILPAAFAFLIAVALGVLARYVHGGLAVALLPALSVALWLGTISLLVLAAALFALAHIYAWSGRFEREYREAEAEERATGDFLAELRGERAPVNAAKMEETITAEPPASKPNGKASAWRGGFEVLILAAALGAAVNLTACAPQPGGASEIAPAEPDTGSALAIFVDTSGSCVPAALEAAWRNLRTELPEIIEKLRVSSLTVSRFDEDGWCPRSLAQFTPPRRAAHPREAAAASEWEDFGNIREAVREAEERDLVRTEGTERKNYELSLARALEGLDKTAVLPRPGRESARTDLVGLFGRIARSREARYVTDHGSRRYRAPALAEIAGAREPVQRSCSPGPERAGRGPAHARQSALGLRAVRAAAVPVGRRGAVGASGAVLRPGARGIACIVEAGLMWVSTVRNPIEGGLIGAKRSQLQVPVPRLAFSRTHILFPNTHRASRSGIEKNHSYTLRPVTSHRCRWVNSLIGRNRDRFRCSVKAASHWPREPRPIGEQPWASLAAVD